MNNICLDNLWHWSWKTTLNFSNKHQKRGKRLFYFTYHRPIQTWNITKGRPNIKNGFPVKETTPANHRHRPHPHPHPHHKMHSSDHKYLPRIVPRVIRPMKVVWGRLDVGRQCRPRSPFPGNSPWSLPRLAVLHMSGTATGGRMARPASPVED